MARQEFLEIHQELIGHPLHDVGRNRRRFMMRVAQLTSQCRCRSR